MSHDDDKILNNARNVLDRRARDLDDRVVARLRAARMRATDMAERAHGENHTWAGGGLGGSVTWARSVTGVAAASLVVAVAVSFWSLNPAVPRNNLDDLEILAASEGPEFYQDLDFYFWLEERQTRAG